jgi:threonyl-tRNA synthetase
MKSYKEHEEDNKLVSEIEKKRHTSAHVLAQAVLELYPGAKLGIGPAIENGFYYDIDLGETKISEDDFKKIEKEYILKEQQNKMLLPT